MVEENRVITYGIDDESLPPGMEHVSFKGIVFPHGIKRAVINGKDVWVPASREDVLASERKRTGRSLEAGFDTCNLVNPTKCGGTCFDSGGFCNRAYDGSSGHYYCYCAKG